MIVIYFSGTGNTKYIAGLFSRRMGVECLSIEDDADFSALIAGYDTVVVCYPIYGSRVPLIMREFVSEHTAAFAGKKLAVFVTQATFSGDGARALCDLFPENHVDVIYAEHFYMPNNVCNFKLLRKNSDRNIRERLKRAEKRVDAVCRDIDAGIVKKKGFSALSRSLGKIQGGPWQGSSKNAFAEEGSMEYRAKHCVKVDGDCTVCYRCVNKCPQKAITVFFHDKPKWQYKGV